MLSEHFARYEFECRCGCGFDTVDAETLMVLEDVREWAGAPVHINSACRCLKYNRKVGSTDLSQHPKARAVDFTVEGKTPLEVYTYLIKKYHGKYGIGRYETFTHFDSRAVIARWIG